MVMTMEYKINELANLAGISTRTLRHYDTIGLLKPAYKTESNYRMYDEKQVDQLQQILLFKRLGFNLNDIRALLLDEHFQPLEALLKHRERLYREYETIETVITTVEQTIQHYQGGTPMNDKDKFNGLKETMIRDNETSYGAETRERYGDEVVDAANERFRKLSKHQFQQAEQLGKEILEGLGELLATGQDASSPMAMDICRKHQEWIRYFWPTYDPEAHLALVRMYTEDDRFRGYYDAVGSGAADLLYEAMTRYLRKKG